MEFPAYRSAEWVKRQLEGKGRSTATTEAPSSPTAGGIPPITTSPQNGDKRYQALQTPADILRDVDLSPEQMTSFTTIGLYREKVAAVRQSLRSALFRLSLFKVQNVEVMYMNSCKANRILKKVEPYKSLIKWPFTSPTGANLFHEELWTVDRCGKEIRYNVRYYKEGENGYSTRVIPFSVMDMYSALKYYLW